MRQARGAKSRNGFYLALLAIVVLGVGGITWAMNRTRTSSVVTLPTAPAANLKAEGYVMGSPSAPVEIIEFADFECPACAQFATVTEPDVRERLVKAGKARFRFFDFPVNSTHRNSPAASLAAACASDQGKFWEMHDAIFAGQDEWRTPIPGYGGGTNDPKPVLRGYAERIGLNVATWEQCFDGRKHVDRIAAHAAEAQRARVGSTPTIVVGTKQYLGAQPFDAIAAAVDSASATAPAPATGAAPAGDTAARTAVAPGGR